MFAKRIVLHARNHARQMSRLVNDLYRAGIAYEKPSPQPTGCSKDPCSPACSRESLETLMSEHDKEDWDEDQMTEAQQHTMFTWGATNPMSAAAMFMERSEGCYFWTKDGKRYLDFNSMAMCLSQGHTPDQEIVDAVTKQLTTMPYAYPGMFHSQIRARLCKLLSQICPGDINYFSFPSSGSEANEQACRIARLYTGRHKLLSRYRSYHGGTSTSMGLTGDQRRWPAEQGSTGHVHFFDPYPYSFNLGDTEEEVAAKSLDMLREQIDYEGPHNIAAIFLETVTGTNGILKPPNGYLQGIRKICDEHGILMVCDEVMAGFGRTGKLFAFCHADIVPDIVTFAKGVNGAFLPLGGVGLREHIGTHFKNNPVNYGSTYNSHPVAMASAYAALKVMLRNDIIGNAARMESVMQECMNDLLDKHPSLKHARSIGLFGGLDIQKNLKGDFVAKVTDPPPPSMLAFRKTLLENGVWTMARGHTVFTNPPLIINENEIREGFAAIDLALYETDKAMEDN
eukprot:m.340432 g.340432  ORF g.340432 m.340432 type:complete len:511 (+) comp19305_c0_seq1:213-1745(+)